MPYFLVDSKGKFLKGTTERNGICSILRNGGVSHAVMLRREFSSAQSHCSISTIQASYELTMAFHEKCKSRRNID